MEPKIVDRSETPVIGLEQAYDQNSKASIPDIWRRLTERIDEIPGRKPNLAYGIIEPHDPREGRFLYFAAVAVDSLAAVPEGMVGKTLPAQRYAVFTHKLQSSDIAADIEPTLQYIWGTWLPQSGYDRTGAPDFELYDERFDPVTLSGEIDFFIPIR